MSDGVLIVVQLVAGLLILLMVPCVYRIAVGPTPADRLQAIETTTTLLIGIVIMLTLLQGTALIIDIGLALAAFSFIATLAIARYLSEGRIF